MKYNANIFYPVLAALLAACADGPQGGQPAADAGRVLEPGEYHFIISGDDPLDMVYGRSRVNYDKLRGSHFQTGDRIGVFVNPGYDDTQFQNDVVAARSINQEDGTYIQVLTPPKDGATVVPGLVASDLPLGNGMQYFFTYPIKPSWRLGTLLASTPITVRANQATKEAYEQSDFMWCSYRPPYEGMGDIDGQIGAFVHNVHMSHLMACIVVAVPETDIDNSEGKGVTLRNLRLEADVTFIDPANNYYIPTPGNMQYTTQASSETNVRMYCQGQVNDDLIYRAVVPAWYTLPAGTEFVTCWLYKSLDSMETESVTYRLPTDLNLKDNHVYVLLLNTGLSRSGGAPAAPADQSGRVVYVPLERM
ncbi:MAG: fimbrillin family protein [Muribaculaceae bacterium]|nr:fimbrillin family protein [Muribaculaceae bacterium]